MAEAETIKNPSNGLGEALRTARLAEAAHHEAVLGLKDAMSLRLQVLKDDLMPVIAGSAAAQSTFGLALAPGQSPRLWIDLITSVIMEPDPRTYRLIRDGAVGRETLFETAERGEMVEALKRHMAHQLIARERQIAGAFQPQPVRAGYSTAAMMFAWLSGFSLGILCLLITVILLGKLAI